MLVSQGSRRAALAACVALLLSGAVACGTAEAEEPGANLVRLYGVDGNMQNSFANEFKEQPGLLDGMKGTTPLTPLSDDFVNRLLRIDPKLTGFLYAAETYDAVAISALATELAGTTDPAEIAKQINGVTNTGRRCNMITSCLRLARSGVDIEYRGVSITRGGFTDTGEPSTASYATLHFDVNDQINDGKTEFVGAGDETKASTAKPPTPRSGGPKGPLKLGGLLPKTGDLALAYPPLAAGVTLAIREINAAGGVLGEPVVWLDGDDGTNPKTAQLTLAKHVRSGAQVIIGAAASGISRAVLPDAIAAGVILFSSSNTDAGLSSVEDKGMYFRTAPSDILQGRALADVIMRDGPNKIALVARKDSYGEGLQNIVRRELEQAGFPPAQIKLYTYEPPPDPDSPPPDFTAGAQAIKRFGADSVLIIGFAESAQVIKALAAAKVEFRH